MSRLKATWHGSTRRWCLEQQQQQKVINAKKVDTGENTAGSFGGWSSVHMLTSGTSSKERRRRELHGTEAQSFVNQQQVCLLNDSHPTSSLAPPWNGKKEENKNKQEKTKAQTMTKVLLVLGNPWNYVIMSLVAIYCKSVDWGLPVALSGQSVWEGKNRHSSSSCIKGQYCSEGRLDTSEKRKLKRH